MKRRLWLMLLSFAFVGIGVFGLIQNTTMKNENEKSSHENGKSSPNQAEPNQRAKNFVITDKEELENSPNQAEPNQRAKNFVITDKEELEKYAKEHGLSSVPLRVEGEITSGSVEVKD